MKALKDFYPINAKMCKSLCFYGIPDEIIGLRPLMRRKILRFLYKIKYLLLI
jgi:hypothetical protein